MSSAAPERPAPERSLLAASLMSLPAPLHQLLRGCALVTSLDEAVVGEIGRDIEGSDGLTLAAMAAYPFMDEIWDRPGHYRIRDDVRRPLVESWWEGVPPDSIPPELASLSTRLADWLAGRTGTDPAEVVGLRLFADPLAALGPWRDLYIQADQRFDLARCRSLIAMLGWMAAVEPEVEDVREEFATYVEARSLWTDEWYRTGSFLLPEASRKVLDALIAGTHGRTLELQGRGGYGKTTHIRWLIARRCVVGTPRIPCARVDFDAVDPLAAVREPHLVLLELADQLDRQLPGDAFGKLVRNYAADRVRLYRTSHPTAQPHGPGEHGEDQGAAAPPGDVQRRFAGRLAELPPTQPVVLILDTLEIPLHLPDMSGRPAIEPLLTALAAVLAEAPAVRLVLAGRYDISGGLRDLFAGGCERFELPMFSDGEAVEYLTQKRGVHGGRLVAAAVKASGRVPFSLALLADLIDEEPDISPQQIEEYRGAEYAYLIERVVKRIAEQPVRWVLRYAAIPRRFDYEFVRDILWRRASAEMNGTGRLDVPADDDLPPLADGMALWETGEPAQADEGAVRQVWDQVRRYARGSSWVSPDGRDPTALRLQPEVIKPLRELLRKQKIFAVLHADASAHFLRRAAEAAAGKDEGTQGERAIDRRDAFLREAVFHRFQLEGEAAGGWWEEQIRLAGDPRARRALAGEALAGELVREPDYTDRQGQPVAGGSGGPLVSEPTLQRARLEFCLARAELATLVAPRNPKHPLWLDASDALERLEGFPADTLPGGRVALAKVAVAIGTGQPGDHTAEVRAVLQEPGTAPCERLWLAVLDARRLIAAGSAEADVRLAEAKRIEADAMGERAIRQALAYAEVMWLRERGALTEAMATCAAAVDANLGDEDFRLARAEILLSSGDAEGARATADAIAAGGSPLAHYAQVLSARCLRRQHRLAAAAAALRRMLAAQEDAGDASQAAATARAGARLESGEIAATRLQVPQARAGYSDAARLFSETGQLAAVARCHLQDAELLVNGLGHLRAAGVQLDAVDRAAPAGGVVALLAQLARAELAYLLGERTEAETILDRSRPDDPKASLPTRMAATAVAGLAFGKRVDRDRFTAQLTEGMRQVTPPTARLQLLSRAHRCPVLTPQSEAEIKAIGELRDAVIPAGGWDAAMAELAAPDRITLRLRAAAFARLIADPAESRRLLAAALAEISGSEEPLTWLLQALRLARQLRAVDLAADAGEQAMNLVADQAGECPLLAAVTVIEYLEAVGASGEGTTLLLKRTEKWLGEEGANVEAWWARLFKLYAACPTTDPAAVDPYLQAAVLMYEAAGDTQHAEEVQGRVAKVNLRPGQGRASVIVRLELQQAKVKAEVEGRRSWLPWRRRQAPARQLRDMITRWATSAAADPYPPELPELMAGRWPEFSRELAELLDAAELARRQRRAADRPDLEVRICDGALQPLPWELAAHPKGDGPLFAGFRRAYRPPAHAAPDARMVRVVQAGLNLLNSNKIEVDGVSGPDTARALRALPPVQDAPPARADDPQTVQRLHQALLDGAPPTVIIVKCASNGAKRFGVALERRYHQAGFSVMPVDRGHLPALPMLLRGEPPPVIVHVTGGLVATAGAIAVDLTDDAGGWGSRDETGLLTSADLDQALHVVPLDWPAPVVVLDVTVPTGRREIADQLLLRNCFAGDLFALGGTRAVIGTGLARRKVSGLVQGELVEGLARGDAIGDVVRAMRQLARPEDFASFDAAAAFAAIALWGNDPSLRLPAQDGS